jgi:hypothetical protein
MKIEAEERKNAIIKSIALVFVVLIITFFILIGLQIA